MAQQTAVEWLEQKIANKNPFVFMYIEELGVFEQAKQMEKEQILDAIINNQNGLLRRKTIIEAEKYYNDTYNK